MCIRDRSHVLGVGGRDLSADVGGRATRAALAMLAADAGTESIIVVSKPPAEQVLAELRAYAAGLPLPVHWAILGAGLPDLTSALTSALATSGQDISAWPSWGTPPSDAETAPGSTPRWWGPVSYTHLTLPTSDLV